MENKRLKPFLFWLGCAVGGILVGNLAFSFLLVPSISIPQILTSPTPTGSPQPGPQLTTILLTGDVMLGRSVATRIARYGDPRWPFLRVAALMESADITYINLENPLTSNCPLQDTGMIFCSHVSNVAGLTYAGVDVASLANNHAYNHGSLGLDETVATLTGAGIQVVGLGAPASFRLHDYNYVFLSFNDVGSYPGISPSTPENIKEEIAAVISSDTFIIATFHWGSEYVSTPSARQVMLAQTAIDSGADLVVGAHPHWVQTQGTYQGVPIYYSLGNFIFDQEWSLETKQGMALKVNIDRGMIISTQELGVLIEDYGQASWQLDP